MNLKRLMRSFRAKVVVSILAIGILAVFIGLSVIYQVGREHLRNTIGSQFKELAFETSQKLLFLLQHNVEEAALLAMTPEIRTTTERANQAYPPSFSEEALQRRIETFRLLWERGDGTDPFGAGILDSPASQYFRSFLNNPGRQADYLSIILTDRQGFLIGADSKPLLAYYGDQEWWQATFDHGRGKTYISDIELLPRAISKFEPAYGLGFAVPVMNQAGDEAIGVIRMDMAVKRFFEAVTKVKVGKTDHTMLASSDGSLIFCPIFLIRNHVLKPEFMQAIFQDQPGWVQTLSDVHYEGRLAINGFSPVQIGPDLHPASLGGKKWYIFTSQHPNETYHTINVLQRWIAVSGAIGAVVLSFVGFWAASYIVQPIKDLQKGARLIGYGNLDHRLHIQTGDEIEDLANELNEMALKLKVSYLGLEAKVAERTKELAVVNRINRIISSSLDLKLIFESFTEEIGKLLESDQVGMALLDESGENIQTRMLKAREGPLIVRDAPLRPKTGTAVGWVVDQAQPFIRFDSQESQKFVEDRLNLARGRRSYIVLPITSQRKPLGALILASTRPHAYNEHNLEILTPIAEQLAIAIETIRLFEQTKRLDQLKSEFVSKVSHEFRTPLTSIKGFTEILMSYSDIDDKTRREFLGIINEESERLTRLINDILDLSKIEAGKVEWHTQPVSITDIAEHMARLFKALALEKGIEIAIEVPSNLPPVRGDRDQLLQVLNNLLSNAIKFTPSGRIAIKALQEDSLVKISVSDTGVGIPREDQSKIFDKFHQLGDVRSGKPRGTGLGLSICKEIIERLGGRIWCESEPNKGSTFYFTLPVWSKELRYSEPLYKSNVPQRT